MHVHFECDEIMRPTVVPIIYSQHLMLQHDNAQTHVERIFTQFLEAENMFGMLWIVVYDSVFQVLPISSNLAQPWRAVDQHPTGHNQQPDQLSANEVCCTAWGKWWSNCLVFGPHSLSWAHEKGGQKECFFFFFIQCNIRSLSRSSSHTSPQSLSQSLSVSSFPLDFNWSLHTPITATRHRLI